jgi:uncharacterized protein
METSMSSTCIQNIPRRSFLSLTVALALNSSFALSKDGSDPIFLSAATVSDDTHWLKAFTIKNNQLAELYSHQLKARAHAVALSNNTDYFAVIARRPGRFMVLGDTVSGNILQEIEATEGRHFYGHGVFSNDDEFFYTTESAYEDMQGDSGRIGVWQINKSSNGVVLDRIDEFPTYGVGPHELLMMPDQQTLVVANGGIRTHPESEREILNVDSMQPSLVYINRFTGELLEQRSLPAEFHQASIRHLDINSQGQVAMSMQFEGEPFLRVPLLATHQRGEAIGLMLAPEHVQSQLAQYVGSIRYDESGRFLVASCPRANVLTFWDAQSGEFLKQIRARDACGVCAYKDGFLYSAGTGQIRYYDLTQQAITNFVLSEDFTTGLFWDNHLTVV